MRFLPLDGRDRSGFASTREPLTRYFQARVTQDTRRPRCPTLPAARLGRPAVDTRFIGQTLGAALLADAVIRAAASEVAVFAVVVDAKDPQAGAFWRHHGFAACGAAPGKLIAPLAALLPQG